MDLAAAVAAVLLLALVWGLQRRFIYFPDRAPVPSASSVLHAAPDVQVHTEEGLNEVQVTVVYGSDDSIVPPQQSRAVAAGAPRLRRTVEVEGDDHNSLALLNAEQLVDAVVEMADLVEQTR